MRSPKRPNDRVIKVHESGVDLRFHSSFVLMGDTDMYMPIDYSRTIASELFGHRFAHFISSVVLRRFHTFFTVSSAVVFTIQVCVAFLYDLNKWSFPLFFAWIPAMIYGTIAFLLLQYDIVLMGLQHFETLYLGGNVMLFGLLLHDCFGGTLVSITLSYFAFTAFMCAAFVDAWAVSFRKIDTKIINLMQNNDVDTGASTEEEKILFTTLPNSKEINNTRSIKPLTMFPSKASASVSSSQSLNSQSSVSRFSSFSSSFGSDIKYMSAMQIVSLSKRLYHKLLCSFQSAKSFSKSVERRMDFFLVYGVTSIIVPIISVFGSVAAYLYVTSRQDELRSRDVEIIGFRLETISLLRSSLVGMTLMFTRKAYLLTFHPLRLSCISRKQLRIPLSRSWPQLLANKKLIHALRQAKSFTPQSLCTAPPNIIQVANKEIVLFQSNATKHASTLAHSHTHPAMAARQTDKAVNSDSQRSSKAARSVRSSAMSVARHPFGASSLQQIYIVRESGMGDADDRKQEDKGCNEGIEADDVGEDMSKRDERDEGGVMEEVCIVQIDANGEEEEKETGDMQEAVKGQDADKGVGCKDQRQEGGGEDGDGQDKNGEDGAGQENKEGRVKGKMYERMMGITTPVDDMFVVDYSKLVIDRMFGFHVSQKIIKRIRHILANTLFIPFLGPYTYMFHLVFNESTLDQVFLVYYLCVLCQRLVTFFLYSWGALKPALMKFENLFAMFNAALVMVCLLISDGLTDSQKIGTIAMWFTICLAIFLDAEPISMRQFDSLISGWINRFDATGKLDSPHLVARLLFVAQKGLGVENAALHHCIEDMLDTDEDSNNEVHGVEMDEIDSSGSILQRFKNIPRTYSMHINTLLVSATSLTGLLLINEYDAIQNIEPFSFSFLGSWESKSLIRVGFFNICIIYYKRLWCQLKDPFRCHSFDRHVIKVPLVSGLRQFEDVSLPAETDLPWT
eukprot:TRINITY_DN8459_c0_g1_i1.p1 TRINITY_DN8459_c0_g1~~TRINITY_DN8459_c0_g1_i1.p1  ORF type:complete len:961 (-),score=175.30 TRINITY_DN8459_c0_g1_i1:112-2994(-)